jgi:hypothetical protein
MSGCGEGSLPPKEGDPTPLQALALIKKDLYDHVFADNKINRSGLQFFTGKFSQLEDIVQGLVLENAVLRTTVQERTATLVTLSKLQVRAPEKGEIKIVAKPQAAKVVNEGRRVTNYASAVKRPTKVVIVRPADKDATVEGLKDKVLNTLQPELRRAKVSRIKEIGSRGLLIESPNESDLIRIKESSVLKQAGFIVRDPIKPGPKLIIYDVPTDMTDEDLVGQIWERNLDESLPDTMRPYIRPRFRVGPKETGVSHRVVEVPGQVLKALLSAGRVYLNLCSHRVREYLDIHRCYKCQRYGHKADRCKEQQVCGHCGTKGHKIGDCPKKDKKPVCSNCLRRRRPATHLVTSPACPERSDAVARYVVGTNYE